MYTTCRIYSNASELADLVEKYRTEVEGIMREVKGFQSYYLVRTTDGFTSITVCDDQAGAEETNRRAADWIKSRATGMTTTPPQIVAGSTTIAFYAGKAAISV
jgi:hypothetical protein